MSAFGYVAVLHGSCLHVRQPVVSLSNCTGDMLLCGLVPPCLADRHCACRAILLFGKIGVTAICLFVRHLVMPSSYYTLQSSLLICMPLQSLDDLLSSLCCSGVHARGIFIQTQPTPNPASLMFIPGKTVMEVRGLIEIPVGCDLRLLGGNQCQTKRCTLLIGFEL